MNEVVPQLQSYQVIERVWLRRRAVPLSCEQSCRLTAFAQSVEGKRFAVVRMVGQTTPIRSRGPLLPLGIGHAHGERKGYYCAELVAEACVAAGLLDPVTTRPAAMYPRDLFFGHSNCPYIDRHLDMSEWLPPARWTFCPGSEPLLGPPRPHLDGDCRGP